MSRFLFATFPVTGHVNPGLGVARELVVRGHDVRWYSTPRFRRAIENIGARWVPFRHALPVDEEGIQNLFPDRPKGGIAQLRFDIENLFVSTVPAALRDLEEELDRETADVLVSDNAFAVPALVRERRGIPWAVYGINPLTMPSRDTAPFGLALMPSASPLGRLRNRMLYWMVDRLLFGRANAMYQQIRRNLGLSRYRGSIFDVVRESDLYLHGTAPSFEYPRTDMPPQVRFVGASVPAPPTDWTKPAWWSEMERHWRVVLVTQGTINNDYDQLIRPAIRALADENMTVVVTTGSRPPADVGIDILPPNVHVERFVPYAHLMPKVDLLVTNGGYGSIQIALAHGVPVVSIGKTEDKAEIANRVEWSGVGIGLKVLVPTETQIRDAVRRVLSTPTYAARAEA
ncbi:MAG TPA: nucleotide disphospho-sugar-binding domain-containing protein, partial [Vicinamibacterales bacterium]|nr:nucleotide disphospho-sugar-binding domain-containing protein [Vicinamibacterales bacterium]